MKLITLSCIIAALTPIFAMAQTAPADTVKVIPNAERISVTMQDNKTVVTALMPTDDGTGSFYKYTYEVTVDKNKRIDANDFILKFPFMKNNEPASDECDNKPFKTRRYFTGMKYVYWGWNFNYDNKAGIKNSFEIAAADLIGIDWCTSRKTTLGVGLGFGFNRVTTDDKMLFVKDMDALAVASAPDEAEVDFARWDTWRFQIPLMFSQKLAGDFGFGLATIVNFNTYSTATNRYKIDRTRYTETIKGLNQRLVTVDFMATLGFVNGIGAYVKWSPMTAMQNLYGPSFRNFSIGVNLNF